MATPQRVGPRHYKDLLTPALHRRFTRAASVTLLICYVEAVLIGEKTSFLWSWFPFGPAGIRTLLLFIAALSIYILRVANLHVSARTTKSYFDTFRSYVFRYSTLQTVAQYLFSAWWFSEVYVWSASTDANLAWVVEGKSYERVRLNERPIYLRCVFFILAIVQSVIHLIFDYDRVKLPVPKADSNEQQASPARPLDMIKKELPRRAQGVLVRCLSLVFVGPLVYSLFLRRTTWGWALSLAKIFWSFPRSSSAPPTIPPYHISLIYRSVTSGFMLVFLWESTNIIFNAYLAQEPMKLGQPLTNEARDPNGTLLTGLNAQKEVPKSFAFWELVLIAQKSPLRRKTIFEEIERKDGSTWSQILAVCTAAIRDVNVRIAEAQNPSPATAAGIVPAPSNQQLAPPLPRLAGPLNTSPISNTPTKQSSAVSNLAKSWGNNPQSPSRITAALSTPPTSSSSPLRQLLTYASPQTSNLASQASAAVNEYLPMSPAVLSTLSIPFRTTTRRLAASTLFSPNPAPASPSTSIPTPTQPNHNNNLSLLTDAIDAITTLSIASLTDDPFGKAQSDIAPLIRLLNTTFTTIHNWKINFIATRRQAAQATQSGPLRTGTTRDDENCEEVDIVLTALSKGLARVLDAFETYANVLGLGIGEVRRAREVTQIVIRPAPVQPQQEQQQSKSSAPVAAPASASAPAPVPKPQFRAQPHQRTKEKREILGQADGGQERRGGSSASSSSSQPPEMAQVFADAEAVRS